MRGVFFKKLREAMEKDDRIFFLTGDTGFNLVEPLFAEFPDRTMNVGVAEQNLIGISAGLCNLGFKPVCYAISNFLVHRCLEQIRNDICLHNYPVVLVGTSTGFDNGALGVTHHIVDDIGCLKPFPNISIYSPGSIEVIEDIFDETINTDRPSYIRMAKGDFSEGKSMGGMDHFIVENPGSKILLIAHSRMVRNSVEAAKIFPRFSVFAMNRIKPLKADCLSELLKKYDRVVVVEDNFRSGLFNSICQFMVEKNIKGTNLHFIGPGEGYSECVGDAAYLEDIHGLSPQKIVDLVRSLS